MNEEKLKNAASEAAGRLLDTLPEEYDHDFSPRFRKKMRALLRREEHPVLSRTLRRVASIALFLLLGFGAVYQGIQAVYSSQVTWEMEVLDQGVRYYNTNQITPSGTLSFQPFWLPEDVEPHDASIYDTNGHRSYEDRRNGGRLISFSFHYGVQDGVSEHIFGELGNAQQIPATVQGMEAMLFISQEGDRESELVWVDRERGILFVIRGYLSQEELLRIAESVKEVEYIDSRKN